MRQGTLRPVMALVLGLGLSGLATAAERGAPERPIRGRVVAPVRAGVVDLREAEIRSRLTRRPSEPPRKARRPPLRMPEMPMPAGWERPLAADEAPTQAAADAPLAPALSTSFFGLGDNNDAIPPDTHGAVGPTKVMTTLNTEVLVQDRAGAIILGPLGLGSFWNPIATAGVFDPRVHFDPDPAYGGRWIWVAVQGALDPASGLLVGASAGPEPTLGAGALFDADPSNAVWADYPSVGFNKNWVVVQVNMFSTTNPYPFVRSEVYVFRKSDLYAATPVFAPSVIRLDAPACSTGCGGTQVPAATYDFTQEDLYLLQRWNSGAGALRLYRLSNPGAPGITPLDFPVAPAWADSEPSGTGADFAPQGPACGGALIQTNDSRIQNVVWRSGTLWAAHTVFLPAALPDRASVQWWQVRTDATIVQRGLVDDPTAQRFHAFPSIAVNKDETVLLGFSSFSASEPASARYAFRFKTEPLGTLQVPSVLKAGEACYDKDFGSGRNRWGDYSATVVDPTDDTRLWTVQEYAATASGGWDRWGTWWGMVDPPAIGIADASVTEGNAGTADLVFGVTLSAASSQTVTVQWTTADGTARLVDDDYVGASGTVTFAPGDTAETIVVAVKGDIKREAFETLEVQLSAPVNATLPDPAATGTILDDDPDPQISIGDRQVVEGSPTGTTPADFLVTLSNPSDFAVTVNASTAAGGAQPATPGTDYLTLTGSAISFVPGQVSATLTVSVVKDASPEPDETFLVNLSGASGGTILKGTGTGVILDDDSGPSQPGVGSLTVVSDGNATSGRNRLQWVNPATTADAIEIRYTSATLPATCSFPANAGDGSGLTAPAYAGPGLVQTFSHTGVALGDVFCYAVFLRYPPSVYSAAANATGRPFDATAGRVRWRYFTGAATLVPPTVGADGVLVSSNDRLVHAAVRGPAGGAWPGAWKPPSLGWPAQERSAIVPLAVGPRVFYGTQDGWVQAIDAKTGAKVWETQIGAAGGAAPAGIFTAFGGAWDYVLVGTAEANGNRFYALDPGTGAVVDYFPKAGDPHFGGIGAILGMASVDYARGQVYLASRLGTAPNTLWCLKLGPASDALTLGWVVPGATVGPIDGSPVVRGDRVYAGNNAGVLWAVDAANGTPLYSYATGDLSVKGFPFPDRRNGDLYLTTSVAGGLGRLHAVTDTGSGLVAKVGWGSLPVASQMSPPLLWTGSNRIFVGVRLAGSGGGLYSVNVANGAVNAYDLEPSQVGIGTPSLDIGQSPPLLHVGGENGVLYAFEVP